MTSVKDLFEMSDWALVEAWQRARLEEINAPPYSAKATTAELLERARAVQERRLAIQVIRLAIRFRLAGRDYGASYASPLAPRSPPQGADWQLPRDRP